MKNPLMRSLVSVLLVLGIAFAVTLMLSPASRAGVDIGSILNDPDSPATGNPKGDVTIVAFLDYNCPFCKKATPALNKVVEKDGKIRLVYKDWPVLSEASVYGARLALAAKYQGKYETVHQALMAIRGVKISKANMLEVVSDSEVNMSRLNADLQEHSGEISALLKRNAAEAESLGLVGTPVFLIGPYKVAAAIDYDQFKQVVGDTRAAR
jgi:protein-disulfide isomerase